MARFEIAIDIVLKNEGEKFTEISGDPGGATKWGITLQAAQAHGLCQNVDELKLLTRNAAVNFYWHYYWFPAFDRIDSQIVATKIFDTGVNIGPVEAIKYLQRSYNAINRNTGAAPLEVDGNLGPLNLAAINKADPMSLMDTYRVLQAEHYEAWVADKRIERGKFLPGLLNRVQSC